MFTTSPPFSICARCLFRRQLLHRSLSTSPSPPNPPPPPPTGFARLTSRRLLSLHGPDAAHFLQGITTTNTRAAAASGWYSAFLNAQGRVLHDVFIYPAGHARAYRDSVGGEGGEQGFLIEVDADEVERLARWMKRYKLRAKIGIRVCERGEWGVWSVWDERQKWIPHELATATAPAWLDGVGIGGVDARAPGMGRRVVVAGDAGPDGLAEGQQEAGLGQYTVRRMLRGVPEGQGEISRETALPLESCVDYMGGIDFRKGCYVGQELTIRTHHTGVVRKRILPVRLYGPGTEGPPGELDYKPDWGAGLQPPRGTNIGKVGVKGRSAGRWVGGVGNVGLALCRLEVMTDVVLTGEGAQWSPEQEFQVMWGEEEGMSGGEARVKAFVPSWHRNRVGVRDVQRERSA